MSPLAFPAPIESPFLPTGTKTHIRHGYFTREGGISEGLYQSLNVGLGSNDDPDVVQENRRRVAAWFGFEPKALATVHQVHSPDVVTIGPDYAGERPQADAMVTAVPGLVLGVLTADCGPVLFADTDNGIIGAAHAGWKGTLTGVLENTVYAMIALGAERSKISACLGPSISQLNYEVGPEFVERFLVHDESYSRYFEHSEKPQHAMFNLPALTVHRLRRVGIQASHLDLCTYADPERFFSYRRTTHASEPDYGRQISAIAIMP